MGLTLRSALNSQNPQIRDESQALQQSKQVMFIHIQRNTLKLARKRKLLINGAGKPCTLKLQKVRWCNCNVLFNLQISATISSALITLPSTPLGTSSWKDDISGKICPSIVATAGVRHTSYIVSSLRVLSGNLFLGLRSLNIWLI